MKIILRNGGIIEADNEQELAFKCRWVPSLSFDLDHFNTLCRPAFFRWLAYFQNPDIFWSESSGEGFYKEAHLQFAGVIKTSRIYEPEKPIRQWEQDIQFGNNLRNVRPAGYPSNSFRALAIATHETQVWNGLRYPNGNPVLKTLYRGRVITINL